MRLAVSVCVCVTDFISVLSLSSLLFTYVVFFIFCHLLITFNSSITPPLAPHAHPIL
jgi:hypothetical protein